MAPGGLEQVAGAGTRTVDAQALMVAVFTFAVQDLMGTMAAAHSQTWGREGRLICPGALGGAPGMGGDSQSRSACSLHILLFRRLYPLGM